LNVEHSCCRPLLYHDATAVTLPFFPCVATAIATTIAITTCYSPCCMMLLRILLHSCCLLVHHFSCHYLSPLCHEQLVLFPCALCLLISSSLLRTGSFSLERTPLHLYSDILFRLNHFNSFSTSPLVPSLPVASKFACRSLHWHGPSSGYQRSWRFAGLREW